MTIRSFRSWSLAGLGLPLLIALTACAPSAPPSDPAGAAGAAGATGTAAAPPDLSGVWMAFAVENPDGGANTPRYSAAGQAALDAYVAQFRAIPEAGGACVGSGLPAVMLSTVSYPIEVVQTPSRILMVAELETQVRRIFLDGRGHPEGIFPSGVGHSVGTWEGDTLVVDTSLLEQWPLRPWPRSGEAHVVERIRRVKLADVSARPTGFVTQVEKPITDDVLVVDITLTDAAYYDGPQRRIAYYQQMSDTATTEYACSKGLWEDRLEEQRITQ
jgi:hypothetical protein